MYQMLPAREYPNTAVVVPTCTTRWISSSPTAWTASCTASALPATSPLPLTPDQPGRQPTADHRGRKRCRCESEL